jgi:L,D-transpeptidase ErfK/SrfK
MAQQVEECTSALRNGAFSLTQKLIFMRTALAFTLASLLCARSITARAAGDAAPEPLRIYQQVTGEEVVHMVAQGETLGHIAGRFGMSTQLAAAVNHLADPGRLRLGQRLVLSTRHIVPATLQDGLVINVGDLMLYWLRDGALVAAFPVGVGRVAWETPPGHYSIVSRRRDPVWHVPPKIQREMREKGEPVKRVVPPGPDNPLGKYWLQLSLPGYGIHGTNAPRSVGKYTTHGCIRLRPDDEDRLYHGVSNGTAVDIINEPIKLARLEGDRILLEAHPSAAPKLIAGFLQRVRESEVAGMVDLTAAQRVFHDAWGIAVDVSNKQTRQSPESAGADVADHPATR